jgi:hypothetical protein
MEHESFENETIAEMMNQHFVNIKVDREERPDLDQIYQYVVQMFGVGGGWPLTMFLTPDREPYYGGTYFPPDDRFGLAHRATRDGSVHVFFVERVRLTSARKGDRRVSGMHWRYHGLDRDIRSREYLAVAYNAPTTTLVHEIGHAFGLTHDRKTDNLMCSCRRGLDPTFTEKQGRRLRTGARRYLERNGG